MAEYAEQLLLAEQLVWHMLSADLQILVDTTDDWPEDGGSFSVRWRACSGRPTLAVRTETSLSRPGVRRALTRVRPTLARTCFLMESGHLSVLWELA